MQARGRRLKAHARVRFLTESVNAAEKAVNIGLALYRGGDINFTFTQLALLQQNLVQQQDLLAQARGDVALGLIQVYRALGGGWQIRTGSQAIAPSATNAPYTKCCGPDDYCPKPLPAMTPYCSPCEK